MKRKKNREVRGAPGCTIFPVCHTDFVSSHACKSPSFLRFLCAATYPDLSSVKPRAESRRSKNNSNYTMPPRHLNENGLHGDLSSCSISFRPLGQSWTSSTLNYSPTQKHHQSPTGRPLQLLRYWVLRYQNYSGQDGKPTLLK